MIAGDWITQITTDQTSAVLATLPDASASWAGRLLNEGSFHLRVAHFGLSLFSRMLTGDLELETLGETQQFVELGCETMIARSLATSLDLWAASICHISGLHPLMMTDGRVRPADQQADVEGFFDKRYDLRAAMRDGRVPPQLAEWLTTMRGRNEWRLLSAWRDSTTHSWTQRNAKLRVSAIRITVHGFVDGQPVWTQAEIPPKGRKPITELVIAGQPHDLFAISESLVKFVTDEFRLLVAAIELFLSPPKQVPGQINVN